MNGADSGRRVGGGLLLLSIESVFDAVVDGTVGSRSGNGRALVRRRLCWQF
jgi:hypothetical protein